MRLGVLDLGSNSFHLLVADAGEAGDLLPVTREKRNLRLGDVVARSGSFSERDAEDAVEAVRRLRDTAIDAGAGVVFGAATSAFRDAANGSDLLRRIEAETGVNVQLIDGCEEGRLVFEAVQGSVRFPTTPAACLDLGGGSLEVVVGDASTIQWAASLPLGVVRLKAQLLEADPPTRGQQRRLRQHVASVIAEQAAEGLGHTPRLLIGAGGTFRSIARMVAANRDSTIPASINEMVVERSELMELSERLLGLPAEDRTSLAGVGRRRADLAPTGVLVVIAAMEAFGHDRITIAERTLKEGLIIDAIARGKDSKWAAHSDPLRLAVHHGVDLERATRVSTVAASLFDGIGSGALLSDDDRQLLVQAALLHEVGRSSSPDSHHKSGARIALQELPHMSARRATELACLIRFQAGPSPKDSFEPFRTLPPARRRVVTALQALLRVAICLADEADAVKVEASSDGVEIEVPATFPSASIWELTQRTQKLEALLGRRVSSVRSAGALETAVNQLN